MVDTQQNWSAKLPKKDFAAAFSSVGEDLVPKRHKMSNTSINLNGVAGTVLPFLRIIRDPLADYQEKKGIAKNQDYTFFALITAVAQYIYSVLMALGLMIYNLLPIVDAFLLILRFLLDKGIDVLSSEHNERVLKAVIFMAEFVAIMIMMLAISGMILVPLTVLFGHIFQKILFALY